MSLACNTCKKTEPEVTLKRCAKCSTTPYCSRDCQKSDWKTHRKTCGKQPGSSSQSSEPFTQHSTSAGSRLSPPKGLERPITKPFTRLSTGTWLHERPETDVYRLLIDAYRLRVEDTYKIEQDAEEGSIYAGAADGLEGFRSFLDLAASRPGLLPPWWDAEKRQACEALGMDAGQWQNLRCAVEKADIIEHYGVANFPMELRMFAERVTGRGPGGANGAPMLQAMVSMEGGGQDGMATSMLDVSRFMNAGI